MGFIPPNPPWKGGNRNQIQSPPCKGGFRGISLYRRPKFYPPQRRLEKWEPEPDSKSLLRQAQYGALQRGIVPLDSTELAEVSNAEV
jgi:hypothetical protein